MRELKFRAWDKENKEWYGESDPRILTFVGFAIFGECTLICTPPIEKLQHLEITQYTGLKDKNGVEIYEGDILSDHVGIGFVEYKEDKGAYRVNYCHDTSAKWFVDYMLTGERDSVEVIGNIYQNHELLATQRQDSKANEQKDKS